MNPYQRAALKAYSEDTILYHQNCPGCGAGGFYYDSEIVERIDITKKEKISLKIGEKEFSFYPKPGIFEVRWIKNEFQEIELNAAPKDWWHVCEKGKGVSGKFFHDDLVK